MRPTRLCRPGRRCSRVPRISPICQGRGTRCASTSNSGRQAEVPFPPRGEADVASEPRHAERPHCVAVEVVADDVPDALVEPECVGIEGALGHLVPLGRPVRELDRALLRDRGLELREATGELGRVLGGTDANALRGVRASLREPRPTECEVLQCEPKRLGVGELPVQVEEGRLQRRQLVVLEVEPVEEVVLGAKGVELLTRELVALGVQRHAEPGQLGAVGVEAACEGLVRHLRVPLDVALHVACGQRPPLRHQEGDERELADELVGVVRHRDCELTALTARGRQGTAGSRGCRSGRGRPMTSRSATRRARCALRDAGATGSNRGSAAACAGTPCPCASSPCSARSRRRMLRPRSAAR